MLSYLSLIYLYLFILLSIMRVPVTLAGRIPPQLYGEQIRRDASVGSINVAGLDVLKTYVCPTSTDNIRRRLDIKRARAVTIAVPMEEVFVLWNEVQGILEQLSVLLDAEGFLPASTPKSSSPTITSSLDDSATPVAVLPSAQKEVSRPPITNSFIITTAVPPSPTASVSIEETISENIPLVTDTAAASVAASSMASVAIAAIAIPGSVSSSSFGLTALVTLQSAPMLAQSPLGTHVALTSRDSLCYAVQTIDQTTMVSQLAVTPFQAASVTASISPSSTLMSSTDKSITSTMSSSNGRVFVANAMSLGSQSASSFPYKFDSQSTRNIAVYYGQSGATGERTLEAQCADPNIDIVILAFVITRDLDGNYPDVNFGAACDGQTQEMMTKAPGLLICPQLESYIDVCQQTYGKPVMLSIGGSTSSLSFSSASDAIGFANVLWQLFGPPGNIDMQLRPFGNVSIDGFDIDNEDKLPEYFDTFASKLRKNYGTDTSKSYYLSSAPQCPFPDASDPLPMLLLCDFVYVQFYNNPPCEIGSANFTNLIQQWSTALTSSTLSPKTRLYLGAPAWSAAGISAYDHIGNAEGMQNIAKSVEDMNLVNFGGVMFWDGPEAMQNTMGGKDILGWTKAGLAQ